MIRVRCVSLVAAVTSFVIGAGATGDIARAETRYASPFCKAQLNPHVQRLEDMRPAEHLPKEGRLGFGPKGLELRLLGPPVRHRKEFVGFILQADNLSRGLARLDWRAVLSAHEVTATGRVLRELEQSERRIAFARSHKSMRLGILMPKIPAFYRLEVRFESRRGQRLGEFRTYVHGARPQFEARLELDQKEYLPGTSFMARWVNSGTTIVGIGHGLKIEQFDGVQWTRAPFSPSGFSTLNRLDVTPGASMCFPFAIPPEAQAGRYRVMKTVHYLSKDYKLMAEFRVRPSPAV
jgi:hypothetical protein